MTKVCALKTGKAAETWIRNTRDRRVTAKKPVKVVGKDGKTTEMWSETDGLGLYLEVNWAKPEGQGRYIWRHQYKRPASSPKAGKGNRLTYGEWPTVSVEQARKMADTSRDQLRRDIDPGEEKRQTKVSTAVALVYAAENAKLVAAGERPLAIPGSFRAYGDIQAQRMASNRDPETVKDFNNTLWYRAYPKFGDLPIADVAANDGKLIKDLYDHVWHVEGYKQAAIKLLRFIMFVMERARSENAIDKVPVLRLVEGDYELDETEHHARVTDEAELGELLHAICMMESDNAREGLMISMGTAQRSENVTAMRWEHMELDNVDERGIGMWTIPRAEMKGKATKKKATVKKNGTVVAKPPQEVPLSHQLVGMLKDMRARQIAKHGKLQTFVFHSDEGQTGHMWGSTMSDALVAAKWQGRHTQHGCRGTFRSMVNHLDTCNSIPGVDIDVLAEGILDHKWGKASVEKTSNMPGVYKGLTDRVRAARRHVMQEWSDYLGRVQRAYTERRALEVSLRASQVEPIRVVSMVSFEAA